MDPKEIIKRLNQKVESILKEKKVVKASEIKSIDTMVDAAHLFLFSTNEESIYEFAGLIDAPYYIGNHVTRDFLIRSKL